MSTTSVSAIIYCRHSGVNKSTCKVSIENKFLKRPKTAISTATMVHDYLQKPCAGAGGCGSKITRTCAGMCGLGGCIFSTLFMQVLKATRQRMLAYLTVIRSPAHTRTLGVSRPHAGAHPHATLMTMRHRSPSCFTFDWDRLFPSFARAQMSLCNLTIQQLESEGLHPLTGVCPVPGCGFPVARHLNERAPPQQAQAGEFHC